MKKDNNTNEKGGGKHTLTLTINDHKYEWTNQWISGSEIRELSKIPPDESLFLAILKPWEHEHIEDDTKIDLSRPEIEHFYSKKPCVVLIVNGREKEWCKEKICFNEVVHLAFDNYIENANTVYTVTYKRGPRQNQEGSMVKGDCVHTKDKMVFNVTATNKS